MEGIGAEWSRCNGKKMYRKNLGCFKTCTPVIFFHVLNTASKSTMIAETRDILHLAKEIADVDGMSDAYVYLNREIPEISIRVSVPKIPGQDTTIYQGWNNRKQWYRKCMHLECAITDKEMIEDLCELAKTQNLFTQTLGKKSQGDDYE